MDLKKIVLMTTFAVAVLPACRERSDEEGYPSGAQATNAGRPSDAPAREAVPGGPGATYSSSNKDSGTKPEGEGSAGATPATQGASGAMNETAQTGGTPAQGTNETAVAGANDKKDAGTKPQGVSPTETAATAPGSTGVPTYPPAIADRSGAGRTPNEEAQGVSPEGRERTLARASLTGARATGMATIRTVGAGRNHLMLDLQNAPEGRYSVHMIEASDCTASTSPGASRGTLPSGALATALKGTGNGQRLGTIDVDGSGRASTDLSLAPKLALERQIIVLSRDTGVARDTTGAAPEPTVAACGPVKVEQSTDPAG